jgi:hypothetical protein
MANLYLELIPCDRNKIMDTIIKAAPLDDYRIEVVTSSGISGVFDVKPYLSKTA